MNEPVPKKSARHEAAERIAATAKECGLAEVHAGGFEPPSPGRNFYSVPLCRAKSVDGSVRIYGPTFITLWYETGIRHLPRTEKTTLRSVEQTIEFLRDRFGATKEQAA